MRRCPVCDHELGEDEARCPRCGTQVAPEGLHRVAGPPVRLPQEAVSLYLHKGIADDAPAAIGKPRTSNTGERIYHIGDLTETNSVKEQHE